MNAYEVRPAGWMYFDWFATDQNGNIAILHAGYCGVIPHIARVLVLLVSTVAVVFISEKLVHSIEPAAEALGMSQLFIGMIIVGIAGNAAEHSAAILMAMKNKMDLAINIALTSATQVVLLIAPLLVFTSHLLGVPMDLHFFQLDLACLVAALFIVSLSLVDGETTWLAGAQLVAVYTILAVVIYFA